MTQNPHVLDEDDLVAILPAPRSVPRGDIARRAYEIYCERSSRHGSDIDDWLKAERECTDPCAPPVSIRLQIKADRRQRSGPPPVFERRRSQARGV